MTTFPSAFPLNTGNSAVPGAFEPDLGMTLRDWFAGQALAGLLANKEWMDLVSSSLKLLGDGDKEGAFQDAVAGGAYEYADAMLAARSSTPA